MKIPVIKDNIIIGLVRFIPNLNIRNVPAYKNEGENLGLKRLNQNDLKKEYYNYNGKLVLMHQNPFYYSYDFAEIISEESAFLLCKNRGKKQLIKNLCIEPDVNLLIDEV